MVGPQTPQLALRTLQLPCRMADGWTYRRTEFLPILQDFVPCRGRCPKKENTQAFTIFKAAFLVRPGMTCEGWESNRVSKNLDWVFVSQFRICPGITAEFMKIYNNRYPFMCQFSTDCLKQVGLSFLQFLHDSWQTKWIVTRPYQI